MRTPAFLRPSCTISSARSRTLRVLRCTPRVHRCTPRVLRSAQRCVLLLYLYLRKYAFLLLSLNRVKREPFDRLLCIPSTFPTSAPVSPIPHPHPSTRASFHILTLHSQSSLHIHRITDLNIQMNLPPPFRTTPTAIKPPSCISLLFYSPPRPLPAPPVAPASPLLRQSTALLATHLHPSLSTSAFSFPPVSPPFLSPLIISSSPSASPHTIMQSDIPLPPRNAPLTFDDALVV